MFLLKILLVAMGVFVLTVEGSYNLGLCKDCGCLNPKCDYPKTADECRACANAVDKRKIFFDKNCQIFVGSMSEGDCALRTFSKLSGCSGFDGFSHYGGGTKNCWAHWKSPGNRRRRDVPNFWDKPTL